MPLKQLFVQPSVPAVQTQMEPDAMDDWFSRRGGESKNKRGLGQEKAFIRLKGRRLFFSKNPTTVSHRTDHIHEDLSCSDVITIYIYCQ